MSELTMLLVLAIFASINLWAGIWNALKADRRPGWAGFHLAVALLLSLSFLNYSVLAK